VTKTLGLSLAGSSAVIAGAALIVLVGAVVSGPLGDRYGRARIMRWSLALYGVGLGLGISLGPLLGGVAIQTAGEDYRWVWLVCSAAILASLLAMRPFRDDG
jgi:MFS family permease